MLCARVRLGIVGCPVLPALFAGSGKFDFSAVPSNRRLSAALIKQTQLRANLNRRPIVHELPDFLDFLIRHGYATVGPVASTMRGANEAIAIR